MESLKDFIAKLWIKTDMVSIKNDNAVFHSFSRPPTLTTACAFYVNRSIFFRLNVEALNIEIP